MNQFLLTAIKGFTILTGFTFFAHSRFMSAQFKSYINPHPIFNENYIFRDEDMPPNAYT